MGCGMDGDTHAPLVLPRAFMFRGQRQGEVGGIHEYYLRYLRFVHQNSLSRPYALRSIGKGPATQPEIFLLGSASTIKTAVNDWSEKMRQLYVEAGIGSPSSNSN